LPRATAARAAVAEVVVAEPGGWWVCGSTERGVCAPRDDGDDGGGGGGARGSNRADVGRASGRRGTMDDVDIDDEENELAVDDAAADAGCVMT
jgi:hypothetical protein